MSGSAVVLFVFDFGDPLFLEAAKEAVRRFANLFVLQARPQLSSLKLGLCALCKPAHVPKLQLQVKLRPSEISLREVAFALSKVQCSTSSDAVDGAQAAMGLYNLVQMVCSDKDISCAPHHKTIVLLTDRQYEAEDFHRLMRPAEEKHVRLDLYFTSSTAQLEATAGAWPELEANCPILRVSVLESPGCMGSICVVTGESMASNSSRDPRTVQLGFHTGGLLHFASPFNIAVSSSSQASLTVLQRVKREEFNPACMVGAPLLLLAQESVVKVIHEGALLDVTHCQLLQALAKGLRLTTAEELPPPGTASPAAGSTEMPQALGQAVQQQLSQMLVLESKPLPKPIPQPQAPANPSQAVAAAAEVENRPTPAAAGGLTAGGVAGAGAAVPLVQPPGITAQQQPAARHPGGKGKKAGHKQSGTAKGLQLKRVAR
ncbi:hypothetical protein N2152v2_009203 [Parachlorella kessleri]